MRNDALKKLDFATCNMSVPVMAALLDRIHNRMQQTDELGDVARHIGEALTLLYDKREELFLSLKDRPN
ncbi:MAG: hypothetical protein KJ622_13370 [Alphaproteobacteria bacterium]|nr:hypothetical protein [Alphaproteobacteria bacterium]